MVVGVDVDVGEVWGSGVEVVEGISIRADGTVGNADELEVAFMISWIQVKSNEFGGVNKKLSLLTIYTPSRDVTQKLGRFFFFFTFTLPQNDQHSREA
jgi:hypothetical protein